MNMKVTVTVIGTWYLGFLTCPFVNGVVWILGYFWNKYLEENAEAFEVHKISMPWVAPKGSRVWRSLPSCKVRRPRFLFHLPSRENFISQEKRLGTRQLGELIFAGQIIAKFKRRTRDALVTNTYRNRRFEFSFYDWQKISFAIQKQISSRSLQGCGHECKLHCEGLWVVEETNNQSWILIITTWSQKARA